MNFPDELLKDLPSTFYRVSVKALIFDEQQRLLIYENEKGKWEIPGGGLEFEETIEDCLTRELKEEVGLTVAKVGPIQFAYSYYSQSKDYRKLCLAVAVTVNSEETPTPNESGIHKVWYLSKKEALQHEFLPGETGTQRCIEQTWFDPSPRPRP